VNLSPDNNKNVAAFENNCRRVLGKIGVSIQRQSDFVLYSAIRRANGGARLNQAFDPRHADIGADDFWLLAKNPDGEAIATYCLRRFVVNDFYDLLRSLTLWFPNPKPPRDPRFVVECRIPSFGGEIVHGGGLWVRDDYRGFARLAAAMPRLARAAARHDRPFDHDSAMIRDDPADPPAVAARKAAYMGMRVYGFARVHRFVDGWFPPEGRAAVMRLCHSTGTEAMASLSAPAVPGRRSLLAEFRQPALVDQHDKAVHAPPVLSQRQQQARV
jgi:hypothetical protein